MAGDACALFTSRIEYRVLDGKSAMRGRYYSITQEPAACRVAANDESRAADEDKA